MGLVLLVVIWLILSSANLLIAKTGGCHRERPMRRGDDHNFAQQYL